MSLFLLPKLPLNLYFDFFEAVDIGVAVATVAVVVATVAVIVAAVVVVVVVFVVVVVVVVVRSRYFEPEGRDAL